MPFQIFYLVTKLDLILVLHFLLLQLKFILEFLLVQLKSVLQKDYLRFQLDDVFCLLYLFGRLL